MAFYATRRTNQQIGALTRGNTVIAPSTRRLTGERSDQSASLTRRMSGVQVPHGPPFFCVVLFSGSHSGSQTVFSMFKASTALIF